MTLLGQEKYEEHPQRNTLQKQDGPNIYVIKKITTMALWQLMQFNTNDNLFKLTQSLKQNITKGFVTSAVFLDVEKAFDQVWHSGLLHKMKKFGMDQNLLRWINRLLCERSISIEIKDIKSDSFIPKHGVPQGGPLSPILFIIYVSDIPQPENVQTTNLLQFADDIALWAYGRNTISFMENKTKSIEN